MKAMSAREAKNQFGAAIDAAQREAVIITKHNRAAAALVSMEELAQIPRYRDTKAGNAKPEADRAEKILRWYGSLHGTFGDVAAIDESIESERATWGR
jgi:prevent-host-death family protein